MSDKRAKGRLKPGAKGDGIFRIRKRIVSGIALGMLLVGAVGGWAATAQLTGAVIAPGVVAVDRDLKAIQHRDGGIIGDIAIREGDIVQAGQILMSLEDAQTRAELSIIRSQLMELALRRARLLAVRDGLGSIEFPAELATGNGEIAIARNGETRLFEGNQRNRESQTQQLELGIRQIGEEIEGLDAQRAAKIEEADLVEVEYGKIKGLADKGLIENARVYTASRERARLLGERGEIDAAIARAGARIREIRLQIIAIEEDARTEAQRELGTVETRISELQDRRMAIEDRLSRTIIRSPIKGVVNEVNVNTIGGVITPAEVLATIVPENAELKVEIKLAPNSIDQVSVGSPARLRFSAFNHRTTPELEGSVTYVAAATTRDPGTGEPYYPGDVAVSADELEKLGPVSLLPGMPVEVFVSTEERTALTYLAKPFTDQFNRAFRER